MKVLSIILSLSLILISCENSGAKKEGRIIRPQEEGPALNIQGEYELKTASKSYEMTLEILNEDNFANILGIIERADFSDAEKFAFNRNGIELDEVAKFKTNFTLGVGKINRGETPENTTHTPSSTSKVTLKTTDYESLKTATHTIRYGLSATLVKNTKLLKGYLSVIITNNTTLKSEAYGLEFNKEVVPPTPYDYLGNWEGTTTLTDPSAPNALNSFYVAASGSTSFYIVTKLEIFSHLNEKFRLSIPQRNTSELDSKDTVIILLEFIGDAGSKITMLGIMTKTAYTGEILLIKANGNQERIGTFSYAKK